MRFFAYAITCANPESFVRRGQILTIFGERILIPQKAGHHWSASETPLKWRFAGGPMMAISMSFRWRADDSPTMNAGVIAL